MGENMAGGPRVDRLACRQVALTWHLTYQLLSGLRKDDGLDGMWVVSRGG